MDVAISVSLSLLVFGGVFLTVYLIGTLAHHDEHSEDSSKVEAKK